MRVVCTTIPLLNAAAADVVVTGRADITVPPLADDDAFAPVARHGLAARFLQQGHIGHASRLSDDVKVGRCLQSCASEVENLVWVIPSRRVGQALFPFWMKFLNIGWTPMPLMMSAKTERAPLFSLEMAAIWLLRNAELKFQLNFSIKALHVSHSMMPFNLLSLRDATGHIGPCTNYKLFP